MIGEALEQLSYITERVAISTGEVYIGPNYTTARLLEDLAALTQLILQIEEAGDL